MAIQFNSSNNNLRYENEQIENLIWNGNSLNVLKFNNIYVWNKPYRLNITYGVGIDSVSATRIFSNEPNHEEKENINIDNGIIYYGDTISIKAYASEDYKVDDFATTYNVQGNINLNITASLAYKTVSVSGTTGTKSFNYNGNLMYLSSGTVDIGLNKTNVTISGDYNTCSYNTDTGAVTYQLRSFSQNTVVGATIKYYF